MQTKDSIPADKVSRVTRFARAGLKVGGNYVKHYAKGIATGGVDKDALHADNAEDVYEALGELKGSVLKLAQMMSMDKGVLPAAYANQFRMAQYSAPPLSGPLVSRTFRKYLGKSPHELFDRFEENAVAAASIGQVHRAWKGDRSLAVKIQYPGVADSIESDIRLAKPFALRLLNVKEQEVSDFIREVTDKSLEETDYRLQLEQSMTITEACAHLAGIKFPTYYPEWSADRILVMDWIEGKHLDQLQPESLSQEVRNRIGQALWDFYNYQVHVLRKVHADPHPGNFLIDKDFTLWVIDFGCVKSLPDDFYQAYFGLLEHIGSPHSSDMEQQLLSLQIILPTDDAATRQFLTGTFTEMASLMAKPMTQEYFDFGDADYVQEIYRKGEELGRNPVLRKVGAGRGPKDALYINRTYFGLYSILHQLNARIETKAADWMLVKQTA